MFRKKQSENSNYVYWYIKLIPTTSKWIRNSQSVWENCVAKESSFLWTWTYKKKKKRSRSLYTSKASKVIYYLRFKTTLHPLSTTRKWVVKTLHPQVRVPSLLPLQMSPCGIAGWRRTSQGWKPRGQWKRGFLQKAESESCQGPFPFAGQCLPHNCPTGNYNSANCKYCNAVSDLFSFYDGIFIRIPLPATPMFWCTLVHRSSHHEELHWEQ